MIDTRQGCTALAEGHYLQEHGSSVSLCGEKVGNNDPGPAQQGLGPLAASLIRSIFKDQTTFKASLDFISPCVCSHCPGQAVLLHFICRLAVTHAGRGHPPPAAACHRPAAALFLLPLLESPWHVL